jgi:hypothetical protein
MDKKIIFVFILLTILSIVNSIPPQLRKRVTVFEPCANAPPITVTEIEPDPLIPGGKAKFSYSGTLESTVPAGSVAGALFHNLEGGTAKLIDFFMEDICTPTGVLNCPHPAKTPITGVLSGTAPVALPKAYGMLVVIAADANFDVLLGCARAFVGGAQPTSPSPTPKAPAPPPASSPPPPPPSSPTPSSPTPSAPAPPASGGIQDSIIINGLFN